MIECLRSELPDSASFAAPKGGYFIWVELPPGLDSRQLRRRAVTMGIDFKPGTLFSWEGDFENFVRLCFTFYDDTQLRFACRQLGTLLRDVDRSPARHDCR